MPAGRPTDFNEEIAEEIVSLLAQGISLSKICEREGMPHYITVLKWQKRHPEFGLNSARAKIDGTHALADQCLEIADDKNLEPADKRVRIDTRIRLIGKWNSRNYGDKLAIGGAEDLPPVSTVKQLDISGLDLEELETLSKALAKAVKKDG